jgi:hypothetical protein
MKEVHPKVKSTYANHVNAIHSIEEIAKRLGGFDATVCPVPG